MDKGVRIMEVQLYSTHSHRLGCFLDNHAPCLVAAMATEAHNILQFTYNYMNVFLKVLHNYIQKFHISRLGPVPRGSDMRGSTVVCWSGCYIDILFITSDALLYK